MFDGERLLSTVNSDRNGRYSYTTDTLNDGTHTIKVQITTAQGQTVNSDAVQVRVDSAPPVLQSVIVNPLEVEGTNKVTISVTTEPELNSVKATADQRAISLAPVSGQAGKYSGEFIAPQAAGLYPVDIEVTDKFNNTSKYRAQATIKVKAATVVTPPPAANQAPTVSVRADVQVGKAPLTVKFFSEAKDSDGRIATYLWNFGDGTTSGEANPTHVYSQEGNYTVTLTVTDDKGAITTTTLQGKDITQSSGVAVSRTGPELWIALALAIAASFVFQRKKILR
ncbi:MAG: PKD domain-containing protein [Candidatus Abawacabacteria bacterium]|nr:PKD domain-containing protein [Candidatus Abawacabacteria bacterium]